MCLFAFLQSRCTVNTILLRIGSVKNLREQPCNQIATLRQTPWHHGSGFYMSRHHIFSENIVHLFTVDYVP